MGKQGLAVSGDHEREDRAQFKKEGHMKTFGAILETFIFLWLLLGVWACANKIREIDRKLYDREIVSGVETDSSKIMMCAARISRLEEENDRLRAKIAEIDIAMFLVTNKTVSEQPVRAVTGAVDDLIQ